MESWPGFHGSDQGLILHCSLRKLWLTTRGLEESSWEDMDCLPGETLQKNVILNSLDVINKAAVYLDENYGKKRPVFGGEVLKSLPKEDRIDQAAKIAPVLRGLASSHSRMVGHFTDDDRVLEFTNSKDLEKLAPLGTSCPDHFLRTKIKPLVLDLKPDADVSDAQKVIEQLSGAFESYRKDYSKYYEDHKHPNSPAMRDPNPVVILWPGVGMFSYAKNKQTARVASEFYINAINVMKGAEAVSSYVSLPLQEAFDIEYWLLEEAKLQRMPKEKPLSRKIALVTGSGGGIGKAIAEKFIEEGAAVVFSDIREDLLAEIEKTYSKDSAITTILNVN